MSKFAITHRDVQKHYRALLEETLTSNPPPPQDESLPVALDLMYAALSMKSAYQEAGLIVARRYCTRAGLDPQMVEEFAATRVYVHKTEQP